MIAALTGGMGCGKSAVLNFFSEIGWFTLSADVLCHKIYAEQNDEFFSQLINRWGNSVIKPDGNADRKKIAEIVFANDAELSWLNAVLHPMIMHRAATIIATAKNEFVLFEIPLLFEAKLEKEFSPILCVWSSRQVQISRLLQRDISLEHIIQRIARQMPGNDKLEKADFGLINNGSIDLLYEQCKIINCNLRNQLWTKNQ